MGSIQQKDKTECVPARLSVICGPSCMNIIERKDYPCPYWITTTTIYTKFARRQISLSCRPQDFLDRAQSRSFGYHCPDKRSSKGVDKLFCKLDDSYQLAGTLLESDIYIFAQRKKRGATGFTLVSNVSYLEQREIPFLNTSSLEILPESDMYIFGLAQPRVA